MRIVVLGTRTNKGSCYEFQCAKRRCRLLHTRRCVSNILLPIESVKKSLTAPPLCSNKPRSSVTQAGDRAEGGGGGAHTQCPAAGTGGPPS